MKGLKTEEFIEKSKLICGRFDNLNNVQMTKFKDCLDIKQLRFDFYIPKNNICIEYQGKQHYEPVGHFGGLNKFNEQLKRDKIKSEYCYNNNIHLIIIKYDDDIYDILDNYFFG